MLRRPPRSTLFPYTTPLPISLPFQTVQFLEIACDTCWLFSLSFLLLRLSTRKKTPNMSCRSEEHTSELQSRQYLVCRLLLEKKKQYRSAQFYTAHTQTNEHCV